jgi:hypothetical protein
VTVTHERCVLEIFSAPHIERLRVARLRGARNSNAMARRQYDVRRHQDRGARNISSRLKREHGGIASSIRYTGKPGRDVYREQSG